MVLEIAESDPPERRLPSRTAPLENCGWQNFQRKANKRPLKDLETAVDSGQWRGGRPSWRKARFRVADSKTSP